MLNSASLFGHSGMFKGISIPLPALGLVLGRESAGEGRLAFNEDSDISRVHCTIRFDGSRGAFVIVDHGSSNGTFLMPNEQRLPPNQEVLCQPGQLVRLGKHNLLELVAALQVASPAPSGEMPRLVAGQSLDLAAIRVPYERFYLAFVWLPSFAALLVLLDYLIEGLAMQGLLILVLATLFVVGIQWIGWRLLMASLLGHGIRVGPSQYPQIHALVTEASEILGIVPPTVIILQGHGIFEIFVARWFSRRGFLLITSNLLDDLIENGSSRELMFFVGRQLGLIAIGFFDFWFFKHLLGRFSFLFYLAWQRRCHLTADRVGLLVAGDAQATEHAMLLITVGSGVAANTNIQAVRDQRDDVFASLWSWIDLGLSSYPYMVDRIMRLREFAANAALSGIAANAPVAIGALPLKHRPIRALPLIIVHGHDLTARLELVNFLQSKFPHVKPVLMIDEVDAANTLPEKFERLGHSARGALALLTPDDLVMTRSSGAAAARARQNVIFEVGWISAKFGRQRLLLLTRGDLEMPSDLSGVEVHRFTRSPIECAEVVRDFIGSIEIR